MKSDLYRDFLPMLNSGQVTLPRSDRLLTQLCGLERRTRRGGRDSIDHAENAFDDLANVAAGVGYVIADAIRNRVPVAQFGNYGTPDPAPPKRSKFDGPCVIIGPNGERVTGYATSINR